MALVYLNALTHGRSGAKDNAGNICVYARDPRDYEFLKRVKESSGNIIRYETQTPSAA